MIIQIKPLRNFPLVAGLFLVFISGCVSDEQSQKAAAGQSVGEYAIRVLLYDHIRSASLKIDHPYKFISIDNEIVSAQKTSGTISIELVEEGIKVGELIFRTKHLIIEPPNNQPFIINKQAYRGNLELIVNADSNDMTAINNVSLETYLNGVVAAEMPSYWDIEALKAQAIAARTYCLYIKSKFGQNRDWDVKTTQAHQVYKGVAGETIRTTSAVNSTIGMVLCCEQEAGIAGLCELFGTYYSSVCGGHTENAEDVFGESCQALEGVDCPYCKQITRPDIFYWPMAKFDKKYATEQLIERYPNLKELETIDKIEPIKESTYDNGFKRIVRVKLTGSTGKTDTLRGEDLRLAIDSTGSKIQSTSCTIISLNDEFLFVAGRGFGHGVGLCQYGARQMAREGKTAQEILNYYYPSSRIKILY